MYYLIYTLTMYNTNEHAPYKNLIIKDIFSIVLSGTEKQISKKIFPNKNYKQTRIKSVLNYSFICAIKKRKKNLHKISEIK